MKALKLFKRICVLFTTGFWAKKVKNKDHKLGEAEYYWKVPVQFKHETEFILFTEYELNKARTRTKKNTEDIKG